MTGTQDTTTDFDRFTHLEEAIHRANLAVKLLAFAVVEGDEVGIDGEVLHHAARSAEAHAQAAEDAFREWSVAR